MYCPRCGRENPEGARFCGGCGEGMAAMQGGSGSSAQNKPLDTTGLLYVILSLFIPGLGHICLGQTNKGLLILISYFVLVAFGFVLIIPLFIAFAVLVYCIWDLIVSLRAL